ncbi:xylulokinase [Bythopirellula goksoeyrii]|uniref:L-xylulose/3-keto-L-gulonate kinase n=1 Tax=Bythopirellula goksoeyrii TaxID=1400387 RepID=A0A5B9Q370_9BACT|nr:FGGY-family carbohydrate kinase [Bythopirellula goksoeyrii]QEG33444.1 L-xylulose/3-keto-L-gulonate kinase [Bythopirellula goksoeyrii]
MYLGLDLGTTNVKVLIVDEEGSVVGRASSSVNRVETPDGGVEQDIEQIWQATCDSIIEAIAGIDANRIRAIGVSSQGSALQLLDERQRPIGRVVSWLDGRGQPFDEELTKELGNDFFSTHVGHGASGLAVGQILRLRQNDPSAVARDRQVAFVGDIIVGRLCGRRAHDATSLAIALLYNPCLGKADPELLERLEVSEQQLPDLITADKPAGILTAEASNQLGLPAGIPVSAAVHDQYATALGAGAVEAGSICVGTGTAWVILANTSSLEKPVTSGAFVCQHLVEGLFGQMLSMGTGGSALEWTIRLKDSLKWSRAQIDQSIKKVAAGCEGLVFWPLFSPYAAEQSSVESRLTSIKLNHSFNHVLRAVLEGLVCELTRHLQIFERCNIPVSELFLCGEGAASNVTPQIIANTSGKPVECIGEPFVSAMGATVLARVLANPLDRDLQSVARQYPPASTRIEPNEDQEIYREVLTRYLQPFSEN